MELKLLPLSKVFENPDHIRMVDKESADYKYLLQSVKNRGVLMPILVRQVDTEGNKYRVIKGLKRYNAAIDVGLKNIPAQIIVLTDQQVTEVQLITSAHHVATKRVEYACALQRLLDYNPNMSVPHLATKIDKSQKWINDQLGLLRLLDAAKRLVNEGRISARNAYALSRLPEDEQDEFVDKAQQMTATEFNGEILYRLKELKQAKPKRARTFEEDIQRKDARAIAKGKKVK